MLSWLKKFIKKKPHTYKQNFHIVTTIGGRESWTIIDGVSMFKITLWNLYSSGAFVSSYPQLVTLRGGMANSVLEIRCAFIPPPLGGLHQLVSLPPDRTSSQLNVLKS